MPKKGKHISTSVHSVCLAVCLVICGQTNRQTNRKYNTQANLFLATAKMLINTTGVSLDRENRKYKR